MTARSAPVQQRGDHGDVRVGKEIANRDRHVKVLADLRDHAGDEQRAAAEFEEIVVNADRFELQYISKNRGQTSLGIGLRWSVIDRACRYGPRCGRQRTAIDLAVDRLGKRIDKDITVRNHIIWQLPRNRTDHFFRGQCFGSARDVGGQALPPIDFVTTDERFANARMQRQVMFNLLRFDPIRSEFNLMVNASGEFDVAAWQPTGKVARLINSTCNAVWESDFAERFRILLRAIQITACECFATDIKFAGFA